LWLQVLLVLVYTWNREKQKKAEDGCGLREQMSWVQESLDVVDGQYMVKGVESTREKGCWGVFKLTRGDSLDFVEETAVSTRVFEGGG
jgi:hypothetical protein